MNEEKARFYIVEVLLALQYLHQQSIAFRDIKPENILLD
jgi:protein-serine/threonine kinase